MLITHKGLHHLRRSWTVQKKLNSIFVDFLLHSAFFFFSSLIGLWLVCFVFLGGGFLLCFLFYFLKDKEGKIRLCKLGGRGDLMDEKHDQNTFYKNIVIMKTQNKEIVLKKHIYLVDFISYYKIVIC